jgi:hypothetical protein
MKELSAELTGLIAIAEDIVLRGRPQALAASYPTLAARIHYAHGLPADGPRCTHAAVLTVAAIDGWRASDGAPLWAALIGAALPLLRAEAFQALCNEKNVRHEDRRS